MSKEAALAFANTGTNPVSPNQNGGAPGLVAAAPPPSNDAPSQPQEVPSKAFSIIAKKEAEIVRQKQELKKQQEELTPILKKAQDFEELRKTDPVAALKMLGFNETEIFNYMANQTPKELSPEEKAVKAAEEAASAKIQAFEDAQAKKEADAQQKQDEAVIQSYKESISGALKANAEKFEYCNYYGAVAEDLIYETVKHIVSASAGKEVPTAEEAAQMVEEFYEEQDKAMSNLKKRTPLAPPPEPAKKEPVRTRTTDAAPKPPTRTLSNDTTVTAASARNFRETYSQKKERLIQRLKDGV